MKKLLITILIILIPFIVNAEKYNLDFESPLIHTNFTYNKFYKDGYIFVDSLESDMSTMINYYDTNGDLIKSKIINSYRTYDVNTKDEYIYLYGEDSNYYSSFEKVDENFKKVKSFVMGDHEELNGVYVTYGFTIENNKIVALTRDYNAGAYKVLEISLDLEEYQLKEIDKTEYPLLHFQAFLENNGINSKDVIEKNGYYYATTSNTICPEEYVNHCFSFAVLNKYNEEYELIWSKEYNQYNSFINVLTINDKIYLNINEGSYLNNFDKIGGLYEVTEEGEILDKIIPDSNINSITTDNSNILVSSGTFRACVGANSYQIEDRCKSAINHKVYTLEYNIDTKTDGNGEIKAIHNSKAGAGITFEVIPKEGYVLSAVKVTDALGNVITFTDYKFTMPSSDVTIEAVFIKETKNPDTKDAIIIAIVILLISFTSIILIKYKEKKLS